MTTQPSFVSAAAASATLSCLTKIQSVSLQDRGESETRDLAVAEKATHQVEITKTAMFAFCRVLVKFAAIPVKSDG